jgi:quercetin dioxygenase-like cupin family protein
MQSVQRGRGRWGATCYEQWMLKEGIPVYEAFAGIEDLTELPRQPWARLGGKGTFIEFEGTLQSRSLCYLAEIPGGGALEPERHLYDELIYILRGRGLTELWQDGQSKHRFEWNEGSLFAMPLNAWHRLVNGGREPVLIFAMTSAPLVMNALRNTEFIFNCPYNFTDRYTGEADYFTARGKQYETGCQPAMGWETNFVPDVRTAMRGSMAGKVEDGKGAIFKMAAYTPHNPMHTSEWPAGKYHKAHWHGPGAILLGLKSEGYVLIWHRQFGPRPFQDGHGDKVMRLDWKPNSIYCPPNEYFHQHFNTGPEAAAHFAETGAGLGTDIPTLKDFGGAAPHRSLRESGRIGAVIEYEDEDPEIRRMFREELEKKGVKFDMEPVVYRTDAFSVV